MATPYLTTRPPKSTQFLTTRRDEPSGAIVIHTAENHTDLVLPDSGAEGVARFISNRLNPGCYHSCADSDSWIKIADYNWQVFGEATGGNKFALHASVACTSSQWGQLLKYDWGWRAIGNLALAIEDKIEFLKNEHGIIVPIRRINRQQYYNREPGFISHKEIDPARRSDPGKDFPWSALFNRLNTGTIKRIKIVSGINYNEYTKQIQGELIKLGFDVGPSLADGKLGSDTHSGFNALVEAYKKLRYAPPQPPQPVPTIVDAAARDFIDSLNKLSESLNK